jgi:hypothetical protein
MSIGVLIATLVSPASARADLWGADLGPLSTLVAQGVAEVGQAAETIAQLKQTYDETRKYVGMAQDAIDGFNEFRAFAESVYTKPERALESLMPDAAYLTRDLQSPQGWGQGTGELQRLVKVCLAGTGDCAAFKEAVTAKQAREAISKTFSTAPVKRDDVEAIDNEAAFAIRGSMAVTAKSTVAGEQARALMKKCAEGTDAKAMQACQSAANLGQLMQVEQTGLLNEQMAEGNRLKAVELAQENAATKRALQENVERHRLLQAGAREMAPATMQYEGGLDFWQGNGASVPPQGAR